MSCVRVFANSAGYVIAISTAPAVLPAIMLRSGEGFSFFCVDGGAPEVLTPMFGIVVDMVRVVSRSTVSTTLYDQKIEFTKVTSHVAFTRRLKCSAIDKIGRAHV